MGVVQLLLLVICAGVGTLNGVQHPRPLGNTVEDTSRDSKDYPRVYEGDMILTKDQADELMEHGEGERTKRQANTNPTRLWPDGVVYYSFGSNATDRAKKLFEKAIKLWREDTCIDFRKNDTASDRIVIYDLFGCQSHVGRIGGKQGLYLGQQCYSAGRVAHEIGHVLGFYHTQSRPDRDQYIRVLWENLYEPYRSEIVRYREGSVNTYNLTYDYGSVLHYSATSTSKNNGPVLMPKPDERYWQTLGSPVISFYDKLMVNLHYGCLNKCHEWFRKSCKNGEFRHPRDCCRCVCPSGYGGKHCDERPGKCGKTLRARTWYQYLNDTVGGSKDGPGDDNDEFFICHYWIKAPPGSTVEVKFVNYSRGGNSDGCQYSGVEIKTGNDKRRTGYRFCDFRRNRTTLNSTNSIVPVITYTYFSARTTTLSYRIVASDPKIKCKDNVLKPCDESDDGKVRRKLCPKSCGYCL